MNDIYLGLSNDIENLKLPDPQLTTYWRDYQDRVFWIDTEITDELFEVSKMILRYNKEDKGKPTEERQKITFSRSVRAYQYIDGKQVECQIPERFISFYFYFVHNLMLLESDYRKDSNFYAEIFGFPDSYIVLVTHYIF